MSTPKPPTVSQNVQVIRAFKAQKVVRIRSAEGRGPAPSAHRKPGSIINNRPR
jgi:hypothetical protein